jgi:hypothetical protein
MPVQRTQKGAKEERKARFTYTEALDIKLLREVLGDNGIFTNGMSKHQWKSIVGSFADEGHDVTAHSLQGRLKIIYESFLLDEKTSKRASGTTDLHME